jgi:hypothetical protein
MENAMSTEYRSRECMPASELFDGRLKKFGCEAVGRAESDRSLTDGRGNYLFVSVDDAGWAVEFTTRSVDPTRILNAIAEAFDTQIFSEDEPQFWGFETWEEVYASTYRRHPQNGEKMS